MALDFRVELYVNDNEDAIISFTPSWWNLKDLEARFEFIQSSRSLQIDKMVILKPEDLLDFHLDQLKYLEKPLYQYEEWKELIAKQRKEIEGILKDLIHFDRIVIHVFEWDSGY